MKTISRRARNRLAEVLIDADRLRSVLENIPVVCNSDCFPRTYKLDNIIVAPNLREFKVRVRFEAANDFKNLAIVVARARMCCACV